jgi:hypothetical protein
MYPGFIFWWNQTNHRRESQACGAAAYGGGGARGKEEARSPSVYQAGDGSCDYGAGLGVRRPLRFLAYKLQLSDAQVGELARVISELKTERAQAEVDDRRVISALADAVSGPGFDEAKAREAADQRVKSAERVQVQVVKALARIHTLLNEEQRAALGYLIRTGTLSL